MSAILFVILASVAFGAAFGYAIWKDEQERKRREWAPIVAAMQAASMQIGLALVPAFRKAVVAFADMATSMEKLQAVLNPPAEKDET